MKPETTRTKTNDPRRQRRRSNFQDAVSAWLPAVDAADAISSSSSFQLISSSWERSRIASPRAPAKIVPGPFHKRFDLGTGRGQQSSVYPQPGSKSNGTSKFVAMLPDFGYGRVTPDHRHDAFVEIVECFSWVSRNVRQDILSAPLTGLFGHRGQLGQRSTVFPGNVCKISQGIDIVKPGTVRSGCTSMRPP